MPRFKKFCLLAALLVACHASSGVEDGDSFGHWLVRCGPDENAQEKGCFLFQNLVLKQGGQRVLQVAVGFVDNAPDPIALLSLPLGISLPPGAKISIDGKQSYDMQIERCEANGCRAGLKLSNKLLDRFLSGESLSVLFHDAQRRPIEVPLSLDGFNAGYTAMFSAKEVR